MSYRAKIELMAANERIRELEKALKPFVDAHRRMELMPTMERYSFGREELLAARVVLELLEPQA